MGGVRAYECVCLCVCGFTSVIKQAHTHTHTHSHTRVYIYIYMYVCIHGEIADFGKSDKMIKMIRKMEKPTLTTDSAVLIFRSLLKRKLPPMENEFFLNFSN